MINPFDVPDDATAQHIAERRTERLREREGMFADFVDPVSAQQIQEAARQHRDRFQATMDRLQARGEEFKARVAAVVSAGELAALEERRASLPDGPEFHADFWRRAMERITDDIRFDREGESVKSAETR